MAVDALTPAELASLGITPGSVPGVGPNAFVGMTPNELKEALDRRGIGYDVATLGQMQKDYAAMFGPGAKGKATKNAEEEDDVIFGGKPAAAPPIGAPPAKDYWGYSPPAAPPAKATDELVNQFTPGTNLFNDPFFAPKGAPPSVVPGLPPAAPPSVVPGLPAFAGGGGMSEADRIDQEHNSPAGSPGSQHSSPNEIGGFMGASPPAGHDMPATGDTGGGAPGKHSNRGGWDKGSTPGQESGQGGQGGQGHGGANGVGNGADAGSGTAGAGQSGEGGQWMVGTHHTGDDGDEMMDEAVDGQVHENEAVIPRPMRNDIGEDILAEAIALYQDAGLTPRERKIMLKDLLGEWAASK